MCVLISNGATKGSLKIIPVFLFMSGVICAVIVLEVVHGHYDPSSASD